MDIEKEIQDLHDEIFEMISDQYCYSRSETGQLFKHFPTPDCRVIALGDIFRSKVNNEEKLKRLKLFKEHIESGKFIVYANIDKGSCEVGFTKIIQLGTTDGKVDRNKEIYCSLNLMKIFGEICSFSYFDNSEYDNPIIAFQSDDRCLLKNMIFYDRNGSGDHITDDIVEILPKAAKHTKTSGCIMFNRIKYIAY